VSKLDKIIFAALVWTSGFITGMYFRHYQANKSSVVTEQTLSDNGPFGDAPECETGVNFFETSIDEEEPVEETQPEPEPLTEEEMAEDLTNPDPAIISLAEYNLNALAQDQMLYTWYTTDRLMEDSAGNVLWEEDYEDIVPEEFIEYGVETGKDVIYFRNPDYHSLIELRFDKTPYKDSPYGQIKYMILTNNDIPIDEDGDCYRACSL
jgi:hypothetical protein